MSIEIPEGKEIDLDKSTIVFKDKCEWPTGIDQLPKQKQTNYGIGGTYLPDFSTEQAFYAMADLLRLRDAYRDGWEPDYEEGVWIIDLDENSKPYVWGLEYRPYFLSFKTQEQAEHFLKHHEGLIKQAIPLMS